jgi:antitoxin ParD1/3/4
MEEFETEGDRLADELTEYLGADAPILSDYAVSREGIYEEHP